MFDKEYYESNNYTNYLARQDRYIRLAKEVCEFMGKMNLMNAPVLDFGCAVGFLLKGLEQHVEYCYGADISEWARKEATHRGLDVRKTPDWKLNHGVVFALDVFEHMKELELQDFFYNIHTDVIVFRMPICANPGEDYVLECSKVDPTHVIRWTKEEWREFFRSNGYTPIDLNLATIYNSDGVYAGFAVKDDS